MPFYGRFDVSLRARLACGKSVSQPVISSAAGSAGRYRASSYSGLGVLNAAPLRVGPVSLRVFPPPPPRLPFIQAFIH